MKKNDKKEKFTPGPWITLHATNVVSPCNGYIARAYDSPLGPIANRYNATLIAAAPEMYEVLERALTALEDDGYMDAESQQLRADISAVLAKARGEVENENKSLGRPSTTAKCTMRDKPPCPDGGQGGGMRQLDFEIELAGAVGFLRALADVLEFKFGECGDKDFAAAVVRVCGIARRKADRIKAVLVELAKTGEMQE